MLLCSNVYTVRTVCVYHLVMHQNVHCLPCCFTAMYDVCVQYTIITMFTVTISIRVVRTLYIVLYTDIYHGVLLQCTTYVYNIQLSPCVT